MDNPFGATSSKPFLDAMSAVSKKFDMQLICLSALSESTIVNQFSVIYQLSLKNAVYSDKSYLQTVKETVSGDVHKYDMLEHAFVRFPEEEQISFI